MKAVQRILKFSVLLAGISTLVLIYSIAVTQIQKKNKLENQGAPISIDSTSHDEDSVEIVGTPTSDDPWKEVSKLVSAYYQNGGIEYKGTIKVIDDNGNEEKVIEEQPFEYTIYNADYYYRLAEMEVVKKKNLLMAIDNENKTIAISRNVVLPKGKKVFDVRAFIKIMKKGKANALVTRMGDEKILTIDGIDDPDVQGYRIYYSPQSYRIHKMLIGMARLNPLEDENERVEEDNNPENNTENEAEITAYYYYLEISFIKVEPLSLQMKDFNPENKFIRHNQDSTALAPAYKDYQLLNTIEP